MEDSDEEEESVFQPQEPQVEPAQPVVKTPQQLEVEELEAWDDFEKLGGEARSRRKLPPNSQHTKYYGSVYTSA